MSFHYEIRKAHLVLGVQEKLLTPFRVAGGD